MIYRGFLLIGVLLGATASGATSGCSGPDPGQVTFGERSRGSNGDVTGGSVSGATPDLGVVDAGGTANSQTSADGGASAVADPVFGVTTFAAGQPGPGGPAKAANPAHEGDASGKDCTKSGCHKGLWAFGGTLYTDAAGAARVKGAEIRIAGPDGKEFAKTFSDVDGNFWINYVAPIPANSRVGVRTADGKKATMQGVIGPAETGCSTVGACHATAMKVFIK